MKWISFFFSLLVFLMNLQNGEVDAGESAGGKKGREGLAGAEVRGQVGGGGRDTRESTEARGKNAEREMGKKQKRNIVQSVNA